MEDLLIGKSLAHTLLPKQVKPSSLRAGSDLPTAEARRQGTRRRRGAPSRLAKSIRTATGVDPAMLDPASRHWATRSASKWTQSLR